MVRTSKVTFIQTGDGEQFQLNRLRVSNRKESLFVYFTVKKYGLVNCLVTYNKKEKAAMYWVTNLVYNPDVITYYKKHFGIETIFGDMKSRNFNIHKTRIEDANRIDKLFSIIGIALLIVFAFGTFETLCA